jgi:hypothetical protein
LIGGWAGHVRAQDEIAAQIQRTNTPPVIDGLGNDAVWGTATTHSNDEFFTVVNNEPDDAADLTVTWRALWDDKNLYTFVEVTDDVIVNDDSCNWQDDSVEFYIDAQNLDVTDYRPGMNPDFEEGVPAYQITGLAGDSPSDQAPCYENFPDGDVHFIPPDSKSSFRWGINSYDGDDEVTRYPKGADTSKSVVIDDNHWTFEAAFPWEAIEDTPASIQARGSMGFGVAVNDDDDAYDPDAPHPGRDTQYMWATTAADLWMRSDTFPSVALVGSPAPTGDVNGDGVVNAGDIDRMAAAVKNGETGTQFDLNGNGAVNNDDRLYLVGTILKTYLGDSNLDKEFSSSDFVAVFTIGEYEDTIAGNSGWADGDWNGDMEFNSGDFVAAFTEGGYEKGPMAAAVAGVPEPSAFVLFVMGAFAVAARRKSGRS